MRRLRSLICLILPVAVLLLLSACTNNLTTGGPISFADGLDSSWLVEGGNLERSRTVAASIEPPLVLKTTFALERDTQQVSPPVIGNGMLVADSDKRLSGFDLENGEEAWFINLAGSYLSPVIADDLVLVRAEADNEGYLIALNGDAATIAWEYKFSSVGSGIRKIGGHVTAPLVVDDLVYSGASKTMTALSLESGDLVWQFDAEEPIASAASGSGDMLYFADFANLYAVEPATGTEVWRFQFEDTTSLLFAPIVTDSGVMLTSEDVVHLVDKTSGQPLWSRQFDGEPVIPAAAADSTVYVKAANELFALKEADGSSLWSFNVNDFISMPTVTETHLYVITRTGGESQLRALDVRDGSEAWRLDSENFANAAPIAAGDYILARTIDGRILVYGEN